MRRIVADALGPYGEWAAGGLYCYPANTVTHTSDRRPDRYSGRARRGRLRRAGPHGPEA